MLRRRRTDTAAVVDELPAAGRPAAATTSGPPGRSDPGRRWPAGLPAGAGCRSSGGRRR